MIEEMKKMLSKASVAVWLKPTDSKKLVNRL